MVTLFGSSNHVPPVPLRALALTLPSTWSDWPEVSTKPPLPPLGPPVARMVPANAVRSFDHTIAVPPSPLLRADTSILVPASIVTVIAAAIGGNAPQRPT